MRTSKRHPHGGLPLAALITSFPRWLDDRKATPSRPTRLRPAVSQSTLPDRSRTIDSGVFRSKMVFVERDRVRAFDVSRHRFSMGRAGIPRARASGLRGRLLLSGTFHSGRRRTAPSRERLAAASFVGVAGVSFRPGVPTSVWAPWWRSAAWTLDARVRGRLLDHTSRSRVLTARGALRRRRVSVLLSSRGAKSAMKKLFVSVLSRTSTTTRRQFPSGPARAAPRT